MAGSIQDLLGYQFLTGMIQATVDGIPSVLPKALLNTKSKTLADSGRYTVVTGTRETARLVQYGAPALNQNLKDVSTRDVKLLHSLEAINLNPMILMQLRNYTNYNQMNLGKDEILRQVAGFKKRFENLRTAATTLALVNGSLWFDSNGNLQNSSSGAYETVDFKVPSANQGVISTVVGAGGVWNNAASNIPLTLRALRQLATQTTGYDPVNCLYGKNIPDYLTNNNYIKDYLARNPDRRDKILKTGDLTPDYDLEGVRFFPGYNAFWKDQNGANQTIVGDDDIIFFPEPSQEWWEIIEGSYPVPTNLNIQSGGWEAMQSFKEVHGMFSYAKVQDNPSSITMFSGDTFIPVIKVPASVWQLTAV